MEPAASSAVELARDVRAGSRTAVEVVRAALDRIAAADPAVGAFVTVLADEALEAAAAVDARPDRGELPLAGVPVAIKDQVAVAGQPTRLGSAAHDGSPADADDVVVARVREAGGVIVGTTRVPELAIYPMSDDAEGIARNPWRLDRSAGGSSGGSAAAVAAGMVPLALGSDGAGSIRIPAAACGVFGLKPGSGVVPLAGTGEPGGGPGATTHWFGMSQLGPLAATVADAGLFLDVLAGSDRHRDVTAPPSPLRVAVSVASPSPGVRIGKAMVEATLEAGRLLRHAGHEVVRRDPPYRSSLRLAITKRWLLGPVRTAEELGFDEGRMQARTRRHLQLGRAVAQRAPVDAEEARSWSERTAELFDDVDVLVTPALAGATPPPAHRWSERSWLSNATTSLRWAPMTSPWNLADVPACSVPAGVTGDGLPLGVQLVAAHGHERRLLAVAAQLERLAPWSRVAPRFASV